MEAKRSVWGRFIPDGLWLIALGKTGVLGLVAMFGVLLLPPAVYLGRNRPSKLMSVESAGATVLMMGLILYAMDNLLNACLNPIYLLAAGGLPVLRAVPVQRLGLRDLPNSGLPMQASLAAKSE